MMPFSCPRAGTTNGLLGIGRWGKFRGLRKHRSYNQEGQSPGSTSLDVHVPSLHELGKP